MTDCHAEYQAARNSAAVFDLTGRAQIELIGGDRAKFLHNFCTNDVNRLKPGDGCEAFVTNIKGRVLGHIFVFAEADSLWIDSVPTADDALIAHLDRYLITDDVTIASRTAEFGELFVTGPSSANVLSQAGIDAGRLAPGEHAAFDANGAACVVRRVDWLNSPGFLLLVRRDELEQAKNALIACGAASAGMETFEALRIEAGFPLYGLDVSEENIAQEVGRTSLAISFAKGCYLGQEPIARLDSMGHVNRQLSRLKLSAGPAPGSGSPIVADDKEVGRITSSALSPADGLPVALAYLRREYLTAGTIVIVRVDEEQAVPARVIGPLSS